MIYGLVFPTLEFGRDNISIIIYTGDFIVVEPISEGDKVKAEIIHILYPKQIKTLKEESKW